MGASFGGTFGVLLMEWLPGWNIQPGVYAMCASAAMLGGVFRASISLVVLLVEGTQVHFLTLHVCHSLACLLVAVRLPHCHITMQPHVPAASPRLCPLVVIQWHTGFSSKVSWPAWALPCHHQVAGDADVVMTVCSCAITCCCDAMQACFDLENNQAEA